MTQEQREKLSEIMGFLWAKSDDTLCAEYAEELANMLDKDAKKLTMAVCCGSTIPNRGPYKEIGITCGAGGGEK